MVHEEPEEGVERGAGSRTRQSSTMVLLSVVWMSPKKIGDPRLARANFYLLLPFASNTGSENLHIGSLNWNSQQCSSSESRR